MGGWIVNPASYCIYIRKEEKDNMKKTVIAAAIIVCIIASVSALQAAKRGISEGTWFTGEFSEPQFASRWGYGATDQGAINKVTSDSDLKIQGKSSIKLDTTSGFDTWVYFPNTKDMDIDASKLSAFKFQLRSENKNGWGGDPWVIFRDMSGKSAQMNGTSNRLATTLKEWVSYSVPLGDEAEKMAAATTAYLKIDEKKRGAPNIPWLVTIEPGFDWKHIASFEIHADTGGYGFIMWHDGVEFVAADGKPVKWWLSSLKKPDLSVTWAEQFPHYPRYSVDYKNIYPELSPEEQKKKHWPDEGEDIYYEVHVKNVGFASSKKTDFICTIDGKTVKKATIPALKPREETIVKVPWKWKMGAYPFVAKVDTSGSMDEISKKNNILTFQTNAYTLFAICEKGMTEQVDAVNNIYGSFSFEDWLRGATVDTMNRLFRHSKYDFAPEGAKIGVRVGRIYVVDKLTNDTQSKFDLIACDGGWSYPTTSSPEYCNLANSYMWALDHELTHQLGIIDDYNFDLGGQNNKINGKGFGQPDGGMMGGGHVGNNTQPAYADIDVAAMNMTYGHRRGFFGEYLFNVPDKNILILKVDGKPMANVEVEVYQKSMWDGTMQGEPKHRGRTDAEGRFELANRPWYPIEGAREGQSKPPATGTERLTTATGCTLKPNPFGYIDVVGRNGLFMVRANMGDKWYYEFIDIGHFVCEYARGHIKEAFYTLEMKPE